MSHSTPSCSSPSRTTSTLSPKLETLPDEILSLIFGHLGSFVLPPLSKRLLPFHRSRLYRNVALVLLQVQPFRETFDSARHLRPLVETLTLNFNSEWGYQPFLEPIANEIRDFRTSLPNLKELNIGVDDDFVKENYPKLSDFEDNPQLEKINIKSWFDEEQERDDIFDWSILRDRLEGGWTNPEEELYQSEFRQQVVVELKKTSRASFGLRYFSVTTERQINQVLRTTPLSHLELVVFTHKIHLDDLLPYIGHPSLLKHLSLFSFDVVFSTTAQKTDLLLRFPNLTHLSLGGTSLPTSLEFYDSLRQLPLESLHFGPHSSVRIQFVIDLLSDTSKPKLSTLKRLILDNFEIRLPPEEEDEFDDGSWDPASKPWPDDCSKVKTRELRDLAIKLGIEIGGTTFEALETVPREVERVRTIIHTWEEFTESEEEDFDDDENLEHEPDDARKRHRRMCGCTRDWDR